ncbi:hypothetical protein AVEN_25880-1 [Araneus ventricosus]|uniref:Uncharacterized protein n=1 Tax=Araneus ventricosus TaxID=182803 RepID=A0A4Y2FBC6_ARAVE|nr:hypothetical protein AVEN_25880-1 [Araneus ventricosus]
MVVEAFGRSENKSIETVIEEIRVQVTEPPKDGFLNFGISFKMGTCQVLFRRLEEMKITWWEIWSVGRVTQNILFETLFHITCNRDHMRSGVAVEEQDTILEQFRSFPAKYLVESVQRGAKSCSIHGHCTCMEINQQQILVAPKSLLL